MQDTFFVNAAVIKASWTGTVPPYFSPMPNASEQACLVLRYPIENLTKDGYCLARYLSQLTTPSSAMFCTGPFLDLGEFRHHIVYPVEVSKMKTYQDFRVTDWSIVHIAEGKNFDVKRRK